LRINAIEMAHPYTKGGLGCLHQQMIMVIHKTISVAKPPIAGNNMKKGLKKKLAILIIEKYFLSGVTPRR